MSFAFLHTADWQIGKPFRNFPDPISVLLREARLAAIDRLAEAARAAAVQHVLVAGDVFDVERLPMRELLQPIERMRKHDGVMWHLLPGNHDPAGAGGVWQRLAAAGVPANLRLHLTATPSQLETGVWVLPAPLASRTATVDPTLHMDEASLPAGAIRIGLAHGSVRGFGTADEAAVRIDPRRVETARLDYLALGDWHGLLKVSERCWYAGTPEPDSFDDNGPGNALIVRIAAAGAPPRVDPIATRHFTWLRQEVRLDRLTDFDPVEEALNRHPVPGDRLIVRLLVGGQVSLAERGEIERRLLRLEPRFCHLAYDLAGLSSAPTAEELERLGHQGEIGAAARRLGEIGRSGSADERETAARALARLYQMVRESDTAGNL